MVHHHVEHDLGLTVCQMEMTMLTLKSHGTLNTMKLLE